ncbi:hypothetical protein F1880_009527 [Penicillium rolfsii]|nr:hypothetical protein F1880_009527 [Penicillium rolfsii]
MRPSTPYTTLSFTRLLTPAMDGQKRPRNRDQFEIAIICALALEANAVLCSLDEIWYDAPPIYGRAPGDRNQYAFGRSGRHPVVVVTLPGMGNVQSAGAAASLGMSFVSIQLALLVGICGAVPYRPDGQEIILGDVIVSEVLVRLDFGRLYPTGFKRKDTILDGPGKPNEEILGLLQRWKSQVMAHQLLTKMMLHLSSLMQHPRIGAEYPTSSDQLFAPDYIHRHHSGCVECSLAESVCAAALTASCEELECDQRMLVQRARRSGCDVQGSPTQRIHFGSIGTADTVLKSAWHRDQLATSEGIIAFEMEGAGVWDKFNCLIIKGVCDYADSHKNKKWQSYAATVAAAAAAKEVLGQYSPHDRPGSPNLRFQHSQQEVLTRRAQAESPERQITDNSAPRDIFDKIVKDFKANVTSYQLEGFRATDFQTFTKELKRIQDEQQQMRALRNMRRVEPFMKRVEALGKVIYDLLGSDEIMCLIWGSARTLFRISRGHTDLLDRILSAYEKIGDELPFYEEGFRIFQHHIGFQRLLAQIFSNVMTFHADAMKIYSGRALKAVFKSFWQNYEPRFKITLHQMRSYKRPIEDRLRATYIDPQQISMDTMEIRRLLQQTEQDFLDFEKREIERQERNFHAVRDWIAAAETETEHNNICHQTKIKEWIHAKPDESFGPVLWINGRPGAGKLVLRLFCHIMKAVSLIHLLASVLIEACLQKIDCTTCYFYCSDKEDSRGSAVAILRSILLQFLCRHRELIPYCHAKMKSSLSSILSDLSTINTILETFCERISRWYVVIDGLDECGEGKKDVLETFRNLVKKAEALSPGKLQVAFLSRPAPEIKKSLPEAQVFALEPEYTKVDIQKYCQHRTRELAKFDFGGDILNDVIEKICIRADGIFLFAKLVINNLAKQPNRRRFQTEIDATRLPSELNEAYTRIMERLEQDLSKEQLEYTRLLLGWLVCSKRPLKWTEIQVALSIDLHSVAISYELDTDLKLRDDVQELCGSLVQVLKGNRVELVHSTARFLDSLPSRAESIFWLPNATLRFAAFAILPFTSSGAIYRNQNFVNIFFAETLLSRTTLCHNGICTFEPKQAFLEGDTMATETNTRSREELIFCELDNFLYSFYGLLVRIWDYVCSAQRGDLTARNKISLGSLENALTRNRALLEQLSSDPGIDLTMLYDEFPFRCPRVLCFYFHEGFKSAVVRDNYINHHDLPFQCLVNNCSPYISGFRSKSALSFYMRRYHPEECDLDELFAPLNRRQLEDTRWRCEICNTFFVRKIILEDYMRSHRGEKPFCCAECGRGFARRSDMKRHEKIHERRR